MTSPELLQTPTAPAPKPRRLQERIMLAIGLVFFGGIAAYAIIPPPLNGAASGVVLFLTLLAMFCIK